MGRWLKFMMNKKLKKSFVFSLIIVLLLSYSVHSQNLDIFKRLIGAPKISNFPLITGDMLIHDNFIFIADNAAGLIYKYSLPNLEFIDKFSALPDLLRKEEVNAIDLAKYQFYFGAVNPFDLKLRSAAKNSIYIKDLKNPTKIRELTLDGKLINILNENIEFRANNIPSSISKQISQKFYNDVTNFAEKLFYDGANLYIYNHQFDKIKIYPNLNDAIEMTPAELFNKYPELLALKLYFERDDFYIGFDNNAYTIKNNEISKYPATTSLVFSSDVNNEPNKFIGIDKNGNYYFWSALELDWYDFAADDININVIKVFDKNLKLIKLLKNDLWSKLSERYNYSRKYIDDEGNIYFVFYNTIEKYRFDGTYISTVLTQENNIAPGAVYITSQYIFVADKNNGGIAVLNNTDNQNYFMIPVTDNKFTVISHDIHKDKIVAAMTNFSATRKYKISVIAQVDEGKYRFDDIHFPQNYIDNIRISKNGRLVAFVEYEEKNMKRLRITDIHGMNKYLLYSTTAKISNIEWINDNNLVFLEDNCRIVLVDAVNNKSRRIFENRGDNISLIYPVSENEIYICADTELVNLSKIQRQSSQQSAAADTGYSINLLFNVLFYELFCLDNYIPSNLIYLPNST